MIRVLLIDDHAIVREGFKRLIESSPGFLVVAEARNADEALSALERVSADIAVVDISLGDGASSGRDLWSRKRLGSDPGDLAHRCVGDDCNAFNCSLPLVQPTWSEDNAVLTVRTVDRRNHFLSVAGNGCRYL